MKLDNQSKSGITNLELAEAIRLWDGGKGLNFVEIGNLYGRCPQSFRYHFVKRGLIRAKKVNNELAQ